MVFISWAIVQASSADSRTQGPARRSNGWSVPTVIVLPPGKLLIITGSIEFRSNVLF
jgi:hypothetical protein